MSEKYYIQESVDMEMGERISRVEKLLHTLLEFCQRNSTTVDEDERQASANILMTFLSIYFSIFIYFIFRPCGFRYLIASIISRRSMCNLRI